MSQRLRILQIFNRYLNYGGEEGSVYRIGDALQRIHDVEYFLSSTVEVMGEGLWSQWKIPWKAMHNAEVLAKLNQYQKLGGFDAWQIHNIFPIMSPVVYERALKWKVPIVHYLHNYRLSCVNGFFLNHGKPCQQCLSGNFWPAFQTACWHESHLQSGWMGLITTRIRRLPLFEKVFQWIAISEAQKREHIRIGIPASKIRVIHHFLEPDEPVLPPSRSSTAIFVGRLSAEKGVSRLLDAWKSVQGGERKLLLVGDGPERANLERQAAGLKGVVLTGFVEKSLQRQFWIESLFSVVPSIWIEPFGMTVLESWSHGRPVIAHNIGAMPELVQDGINGFLSDPGDCNDLAHKMENLFSNSGQSEAMGRAGRVLLEKEFNREKWLNKIAEIYHPLQKGL
ncbi:MAG TPA: glycosyltransferase family 4 protein [Candidatus Methylacidiphilales bacterium]|nr:glycosyltransferase family 4 protein [Candidatus Methylacidiphilales bacterium]